MGLEELKAGKKFNMNCPDCKHTGIRIDSRTIKGLGYICPRCNGKGFVPTTVKEKDDFYIDVDTNTIIELVDDFIYEEVGFTGLAVREDITHVVYASNTIGDAEYFIEKGYDKNHVVPYKDFLKTVVWPMPLEDDTCPARLESDYCKTHTFNNGCVQKDFDKCSNYKNSECWTKFFSGCASHCDKVLKLMRMNQNNNSENNK